MEKFYKKSGVDVEAGYAAVRLIKPLVEKTYSNEVLGSIGGFGGAFCPNISNFKEPTFVAGTDGVGTKVKIAEILNIHDSIGIDCVAMCANDIVCCGAKPLFFLDYIACGQNDPKKIEKIVSGIANGCIEAGASLIGGETAEHPGIMKKEEYDIAGFMVGIIEKSEMLPKKNLKKGDVLIAMPSNGVHSNGFSLLRKIFDIEKNDLEYDFGILEENLGSILLKPTKIYVKPVLALLKKIEVKAICHITGGGFYENIPRVLQNNVDAIIYSSKLKIPKIFELVMKKGKIAKDEMFNIFNMGVGMVLVVSEKDVDLTLNFLKLQNMDAYVIGKLENGSGKLAII